MIKSINAQVSFYHSLGVSFFLSPEYGVPALTYSPRINLLEIGKIGTLSAGTHLSIGLTSNAFIVDGLFAAEINIGNGSKEDVEQDFGFFFGGGVGGNWITDYDEPSPMRGPIVNAGFVFQDCRIRFSLLKNIKKYSYEDDGILSAGILFGL